MTSSFGSLERAGLLSWCPDQEYPHNFAVGCNSAFSEAGYLRLYNLDLTNPGDHFQLINEYQMEERFSCLAWGAPFNPDHPHGLIAGGMHDGSLMLWDAATFIESDRNLSESLLAIISLYDENQFSCLEWGPFKKEKLATGGSNLYIADLEKSIDNPEVFCPNNKKEQDPITSVSWNKNKTVPHILATATSTGIVNVWDLKVKKSISSFRDKSQETNRDVRISWNPNIPTQMAVVFDDAREPGIQIWDLRNSKAPVTVFKDNHKNVKVNSLAWSVTDANLVLSADRNNLVSCQNIKTNETIILEQEARDLVSVQFADVLQSVFVLGDIDGTLSFHTLDQNMLKKLSTTHAPKWMKNPAAVACDMNGGLSFRESSGDLASVRLEQSGTDSTSSALKTLAEVVEDNSVDAIIKQYSKENKDLWALINASDMSDEQMLQSLGFNSEEIVSKTENLTGKSHKKKVHDNRRSSNSRMTFEFTDMNPDQAEDFFNQLSKVDDTPDETQNAGPYDSHNLDEQETRITRNENWDAGLEDLIRKNLIIGNFHGAIDCAIKAGRYAHAFLIAYSKKDHPELLLAAAEGIALINNDRISTILQNMIEDKVEDLIEGHDLKRWKELAALIIGNYPHQKDQLLHKLSLRLQKENMMNEALSICLISHDFQALFEIITSNIAASKGKDLEKALIRNFIVLFAIGKVTGQVSTSRQIQTALCKLIHLMIEQEEFKLAMRFLEELGDGAAEEIAFLKTCIYYANESSLKMCFSPPEYNHAIKVKPPAKPAQHRGHFGQSKASTKPTQPSQPASDSRRKPLARPQGATWSEKGHDDDSASMNSEVDPNKHFGHNQHQPPVAQNMSMAKRPGPAHVRPGPPPAPGSVAKVPQPTPARPGPPPPKTNFSNKSTEEVVEHHLASSKVSENGGRGPPRTRPGPPMPKHHETQSQGGADHHAPARPGPPPAPPKTGPAPPARPGPPPVTAPPAQPPKVQPPTTPTPPPPTQPPVQQPPKTGPPRPAGPIPVPKQPVSQPPVQTPPKDVPQAPPKTTPAPPAPARPGPPQPKAPENPAPPVPGRPGPPAPPARPGPPATGPQGGPQAPRPAPPGPPGRAGPPAPGNPPQPPAHKGPAPPAPQGQPPKGVPPPRGPPPRQEPAQEDEEEETEQESVISGLDQCLEFIRDIASGAELATYQSALDKIKVEVQKNSVPAKTLTLMNEYFEHLSNSDTQAASTSLGRLKATCPPKDKNWLKAFEVITQNY